MFHMMDNGLRCGVSLIIHRYAKANNPQMEAQYDPAQPLAYITYLYANNLFGQKMSHSLRFREFRWVDEKEWVGIDCKPLPDDGIKGYILEVDRTYPATVHVAHNDYTLSKHKRQMQYELLNDSQIRNFQHYNVPRTVSKCRN